MTKEERELRREQRGERREHNAAHKQERHGLAAGGVRLRLLPPLTLTAHDVEMALEILGSVLAEMDPSKTEEQA